MVARGKTELESQIREWIKKNPRENRRLEFKQRIDLGPSGAKAEFIRDVIALANSEGEFPRSDGYLVIGFRDGKCNDIRGEGYDGAKFAQLLDSFIAPPISVHYDEYSNGRRGRIGVLIVAPDPDQLYLVRKRLVDENGRPLLIPGQCWGRKSSGKVELGGDTIQSRLAEITNRRMTEATTPLAERIASLERESGPALEVKRIRFAMEATHNWNELESLLEKLMPYASEFDHHVKHEVLDAVRIVTDRLPMEMTLGAFGATDRLLGSIMPIGSGGMSRPSRREFSKDDLELLERVGDLTYELMWDVCRYVRDLEMVKTVARRYWYLIRTAKINKIEGLGASLLEDIRHCQKICGERRGGADFVEAEKLLESTIRDALDVSRRA